MIKLLPARVRTAAVLATLAAGLVLPGGAFAQSSAVLAEQSMRLDRVESDMRQLNGRMDEISWQLQQIQDLLRRMQEDNEYRFQELEGGQPRKRSDAAPLGAPSDTASTFGGSGDDLSTGFSIDAPGTVGAPPQPLGTLPAGVAAGQAPPSGGLLGGPLDLSAIASGSPIYQAPATVSDLGNQGPLPPLGVPVASNDLPPPGATGSAGTAPSSGGGFQVAAIAPPADPQAAYDEAYGRIVSGDYTAAEAGFRRFLASHPDSRLAGNAQFWLGESFYARGSFKEAAEAFLTAYRDYPSNAKAPESLLKLGLSLEKLGETDAACATYGELANKYPSATGALKTRVAEQRKKAGC